MQTEEERWREYYEARQGYPARPTLTLALRRFEEDATPVESPVAVDMGCGDGPDTLELLRRGWRVFAFDGQEEAIRRLRERSDLPPNAVLEARVQRFENATWPDAHLINASYAPAVLPARRFSRIMGAARHIAPVRRTLLRAVVRRPGRMGDHPRTDAPHPLPGRTIIRALYHRAFRGGRTRWDNRQRLPKTLARLSYRRPKEIADYAPSPPAPSPFLGRGGRG